MERGQDTVDQRLAVALVGMLGVQEQMADSYAQAASIAEDDMLEAVMRRQYSLQAEVTERLEAIVKALAGGKLFIVEEGALVHALAEQAAQTWNAAQNAEVHDDVTKNAYVREAQLFLMGQKTKGVIS